MESEDFKAKRINYLNNWPNVEPFEIEKKYYFLIEKIKKEESTIFLPFHVAYNQNVTYNKTISFIIEALDQLEKYPKFSYEFIFKAYDCFSNEYYNSSNITDKNKKLCDNEWKNAIDSNCALKEAMDELFCVIPVKACQYLYIRLSDHIEDDKPYKRVTTDISGSETDLSRKRKEIIDAIEVKYGADYNNYAETIRKASLLYRYILKNDSVHIDKNYTITTEDKLDILVSGLLYTLRNDTMHGSSIAITKSSKTTIGIYAIDYYSFLLLYYLLIILIIKRFPQDYSINVYEQLADNILCNIKLFTKIFGKHIER